MDTNGVEWKICEGWKVRMEFHVKERKKRSEVCDFPKSTSH